MAKVKSMPMHKDWKEFKKKYKVPDGVVKNVHLGKAIDAYWANAKQSMKPKDIRANIAECEKLEKIFVDYISKFPKDKVKDYNAFSKAFLDNFGNVARALKEDWKRYVADAAVYTKELLHYFSMVQKLAKGKTTIKELEQFKSGPMRGLSAVGSSLQGYDLSGINTPLGPINMTIDGYRGNATREQIDDTIDEIFTATLAVKKAATELGLV